ncbi:Urb2 domain-containing protein [Pseudozyma hubeiensis]|nr:Urb2 domain-containing protein [Pseudozyma hubeiensis]
MPTATVHQALAADAGPSALALASITTSEQLVKTLRVPQPLPNGVRKIDIALDAWRSQDLFVPKKAELLSQWALEHLCSSLKSSSSSSTPSTPNKGKNKAKQQQHTSASPIELDPKSWQLLSDIVTAQISTSSDLSEAAKRSWLSHLANTQPVLTLAGSFARQLNQDASLSLIAREELLETASSSLQKLLPPSTSRTAATNVEAATDSIQAWLDFFGQTRSPVEQRTGYTILHSITSTWSTTLHYGSNSKRNHQHFCNNAVPSLLRALHSLQLRNMDGTAASTHHALLLDTVKQIAADSLFTEDVQRSLLQAGRLAEHTSTPSWKESPVAASGVVSQICASLQDQHLSQAALGSLAILADLLCAKLSRSEALNSIVSSSNLTSSTVHEAQLSLIRKTMLSQWYFSLLPHLVTCAQALSDSQAASRRDILAGVERHSLYTIGSDEAGEWRSLFSALFDTVHHELSQIATDASPAAQDQQADHFACLASLWRLEKSVVEDDLVSIMALVGAQRVSKPALWLAEDLSAPTLAALDFFRAVAAIDVRFRTVPSLVNTILSSIPLAAEHLAKTDDDSSSASLFVSQTFLTELGKLCRASVTAMQVPELIQRLTSLAQNLDPISQSSATPKASKKARTSLSNPAKVDAGRAKAANALITQLQIVAQVVQSVNLAPPLRTRSTAAAEELHNNLIVPCIDLCLASTRTATSSPTLCGVAAAALRVRQALLSEKWRYDPAEPVKLDGSLPTESLTCLEEAFDGRADSLIELLSFKQDGSPELHQLQFQIVQSLLQRAERDSFLELRQSRYCRLVSEADGPIHKLLSELTSASSVKGRAWSGRPDRIRRRSDLMQTVWMAIVTRWAPLFDSIAATESMQLLANTIVESAQPSSQHDDIQSGMRYITSSVLRSASFLELPNWRRHIVATLQQELASQPLERRLRSTAALCITPSEWVNKSARGQILKALLSLDREIVTTQQTNQAPGTISATQWIELRSLLARVQESYATEADISNDELFDSLQAFWSVQAVEADEAHLQHEWERASLAALHSADRVLLSRLKQDSSAFQRFSDVVKQLRRDAAAESVDDEGRILLKMRAAQQMMATLNSAGSQDAASQDGAGSVQTNLDAILQSSSAHLETAGEVVQTLDLLLYHLREVRLLAGPMNGEHGSLQELLQRLSMQVVRSLCIVFSRANALAVGDEAFKLVRPAADVALELVRCIDACGQGVSDGNSALAACLAFSALTASLPTLQQQKHMVQGVERIVSRLGAEEYDVVLSKLLIALRSTASASIAVDGVDAKEAAAMDGDEAALISTVGLVLGGAPEGTSKIARSHLSTWLAVMTSSNAMANGGRIELRSMVAAISALDLLCSHHAMLLRTQDLGAVLQLFATVTGPSSCDEPLQTVVEMLREELDVTRTKLFNGIVSTLSSLMRLRQDLVVGFLPQLGLLLSRLITLFRRLRRSASGKIEASGSQRRSLRRDLPVWLDPVFVSPLTADSEARALSRLLSNLVAKNVSLKHRSSDSTTVKAESLARAFGKHATYVLVAYLKSLTAQNSVVPVDVRTELEVGMMTICAIMGTHQRDAAMVGLLDSAGKVLLKRIWGVFEGQRYKGQ